MHCIELIEGNIFSTNLLRVGISREGGNNPALRFRLVWGSMVGWGINVQSQQGEGARFSFSNKEVRQHYGLEDVYKLTVQPAPQGEIEVTLQLVPPTFTGCIHIQPVSSGSGGGD